MAKQAITLRGSSDTVTEFFTYAINSILYQRGLYPSESFRRVSKYGLTMLVTSDDELSDYIDRVLRRYLHSWLLRGSVQRLVLVLSPVDDPDRVLERWHFDVHVEEEEGAGEGAGAGAQRDEAAIVGEIQAIIRQITASVTFLPLLNEPCTFDLLVYTDAGDEQVGGEEWEESDPRYISSASEQVRLRSFTTRIHRVDAAVAYAAAAAASSSSSSS